MDLKPIVSVIVTTKNEGQNLASCLESIKAQSYPRSAMEIIVVDNNSTDKTQEIARFYTDKVYNWGPERSAQRNLGIKQAIGKYVIYLDSDMVLSREVVGECVTKSEEGGYIALYIPENIIGEKGYWIEARNLERSFYNATVIDCVRFVRRDNALEINGFDENLTGPEDWDFDRRIKKVGTVGMINASLSHNERRFSIRRYISKKIYYTPFFDKYIQKWGRRDSIVKKQLGFWYRCLWVFVEKGKWRRLVCHPFLAAGIFFLKFMVGLSYVCSWLVKNE